MTDNLFEQYINESTEPLAPDIDEIFQELIGNVAAMTEACLKTARLSEAISHLSELYNLDAITLDEMQMIVERVKDEYNRI